MVIKIARLLSQEEDDFFEGKKAPRLLADYQKKNSLFFLEQMKHLIKKVVVLKDQVLWQEKLAVYKKDFIRYQYFLEALIASEKNSPLELQLHGRYYKVKLLYVKSQSKFFHFVAKQNVKLDNSDPGASSRKLNDWFDRVMLSMAEMEKTAMEK